MTGYPAVRGLAIRRWHRLYDRFYGEGLELRPTGGKGGFWFSANLTRGTGGLTVVDDKAVPKSNAYAIRLLRESDT